MNQYSTEEKLEAIMIALEELLHHNGLEQEAYNLYQIRSGYFTEDE